MAKTKFAPLPPKNKMDRLRAFAEAELKRHSHPSDDFDAGFAAAMRSILRRIDLLDGPYSPIPSE